MDLVIYARPEAYDASFPELQRQMLSAVDRSAVELQRTEKRGAK